MASNQLLLEKEKDWLNTCNFAKNTSSFVFKINTKTQTDLIQKVKELLFAVHEFSDDDWQDLEHAVLKLPSWFLKKSPLPMSASDEVIWLNKWRSATPQDQIKMDSEQGWAPADWLYWMNPDTRLFFLTGYSDEENCFVFETTEWDAPTGAARWMLKITGHVLDRTGNE